MDFERNEHPFDEKKNEKNNDIAPRVKPEGQGLTLYKRHFVLIGTVVFLIFAINIGLSFLLYNIYLNKLYPLAINQNNYTINYSFDEEPLIAITDMNARFVVEILAGTASGTGVIIKKDNNDKPYILTNYHVIKDVINQPQRIQVKLYGSAGYSYNEKNPITILGYDEYNDIAVLKFDYSLSAAAYSGKSITLPDYVKIVNNKVEIRYNFEGTRSADEQKTADEDMPVIGRRVLAIGNAIGQGLSACDGIISKPLVNVKTQSDNEYENTVIQITAPINPGNSGGALFNMKGQIIGINTYKVRTTTSGGSTIYVDNISYAVPIELALSSAYRIIDNYGKGTASPIKNKVMTFYNLGLLFQLHGDIIGVQETSILAVTLRAGTISAGWSGDNGYPASSDWDDGKRINIVTEVAGVRFAGAEFNGLSLFEKQLLVLKADCLLYDYQYTDSGIGEAFTVKQISGAGSTSEITFTAAKIRKI